MLSVLTMGGKRISAIPVLTTSEIQDVYTTTGSENGEKFIDFFCQCVLPIIMPFNGIIHIQLLFLTMPAWS